MFYNILCDLKTVKLKPKPVLVFGFFDKFPAKRPNQLYFQSYIPNHNFKLFIIEISFLTPTDLHLSDEAVGNKDQISGAYIQPIIFIFQT